MNRLQGIKNIYLGFLMIFLSICLLFPSLAQSQSESEPNNTPEHANEIRLGQSIQGLFQPKGDEDWYKFVNSQSGKNIIRIDLTGVAGVNSYIEIYNEKEESLKESDTGDDGEGEAIINFGVTEGTYYIEVYGHQKNEKNKYTLSTKFLGPWQEGQEFEPNDELEQANKIQLGKAVNGFAHPDSDEDWYTVTLPESGLDILVVELSGLDGVDLSLELLDADGQELKEANNGEMGEKETIVRMKVKPGKYYIVVNNSGFNVEKAYSLRAGKPTVPPATPEEVNQAL
ncbi:MAG: PPC domain-containing protein, partial [Acidobacteriota bacterium]|nr:PPC domain-containing protein [Acidobacteriota bacterium]